MEPWMIVFFPIMIGGGLFAIWLFGNWVFSMIADPFWAKKKANESEIARIKAEEDSKIKEYTDALELYNEKLEKLAKRECELEKREAKAAELEANQQDIIHAYTYLHSLQTKLSDSLTPIFGASTIYRLTDAMSTPRFTRGMDGRFTFATDEKIVAKIQSGDTEYQTSLTGCSCPATERPCKHMLWLAAHLGILQMNRTKQDYVLAKIYNEQMRANRMLQDAKHAADKVDKRERRLDDKEKILKEKQLGYPWMTRILCQYDAQIDDLRLQKLKATNARLAQEQISAIKKEKQALLKENLLLRNRQTVYESLFPWLKIVSESNITPDDAVRISAYINEDEDYITFLRKILTVEEYTTLSPAEKFMCAVEHCRKNKPPEK